MKRSELKRLIKPLVKECIQESLMEDGILSKVISEVVMGLNSNNNLVKEDRKVYAEPEVVVEKRESESLKNLKTNRQQMLDAIGNTSYNGVNLFEGTAPLGAAGTPGEVSAPSSALSGVDARDPGVDIGDLTGIFGDTWKAIGNG
jgi:hypothetical protein